MFKHKKEMFKFSGRNHSVKGMISVILGGISVAALVTLSIISSLSHGNSGLIIGVIGILLMGISIAGFILGIRGCKEKEIYYTLPVVGMVMNGILFIVYFTLYIVGAVI